MISKKEVIREARRRAKVEGQQRVFQAKVDKAAEKETRRADRHVFIQKSGGYLRYLIQGLGNHGFLYLRDKALVLAVLLIALAYIAQALG